MRSLLLPRGLRARIEQFERDVRHISRRLRGITPPPVVEAWSRPVRLTRVAPLAGAARDAATEAVRIAVVESVVRETDDAVTITLRIEGSSIASFRAGQFLTVEVSLPDETVVRRNYSLSSTPADLPRLAITVKRVRSGALSPYLTTALSVGARIRVSGPHGSFVLPTSVASDHQSPVVLIGGGSGITPLHSLLRHELATSTRSVALVYANTSVPDTIFRATIDRLADAHSSRFTLRHIVGEAHVQADTLEAELGQIPFAGNPRAHFFVCGPEGLREVTRSVLAKRGIPRERIFEERYTHGRDVVGAREASFVFELGTATSTVSVLAGRTLLDAGLGAGLPLASSCTMGGCGACRVRLLDGEVTMEEPNCLTDEERAQGYVLACISRPKTDTGRVRARTKGT